LRFESVRDLKDHDLKDRDLIEEHDLKGRGFQPRRKLRKSVGFSR
jgi:hypothetical protein